MKKSELRTAYKLKRNALSDSLIAGMDQLMLLNLQSLPWDSITYLHCYLAIGKFKEYNTQSFIEWIWQNHPQITVLISKSDFQNHELTHYRYDAQTELQINAWGIAEPVGGQPVPSTRIDAVLTPLLVVDEQGNRVGYGKGFYDRFFSTCRADVLKLGLSYFEPVSRIEDTQIWDIPVSMVVTPERIYYF